MDTKFYKNKHKRLSKGERTHVRRMKQETGRSSVPHKLVKKPVLAAEAPKA